MSVVEWSNTSTDGNVKLTVKCDGCGCEFIKIPYNVFLPMPLDMYPIYAVYGWIRKDGKDLCKECAQPYLAKLETDILWYKMRYPERFNELASLEMKSPSKEQQDRVIEGTMSILSTMQTSEEPDVVITTIVCDYCETPYEENTMEFRHLLKDFQHYTKHADIQKSWKYKRKGWTRHGSWDMCPDCKREMEEDNGCEEFENDN